MAASGPKQRLIIVADDTSATEVANEQVAGVVKNANIVDGVATMATDHIPDDVDVFCNDEFGVVQAQLTDKQAQDLDAQSGVVAVEDDEIVTIFSDGLDDQPPADPDAAALIDGALTDLGADELDDIEAHAHEQALLAAERDPGVVDDVAFDELGQVVSDTAPSDDPELAAIPRDQLFKLVRCVISCAIETTGGKVAEVTDEQIAALLAGENVPGGSARAAAIRDYITCGLRIIWAPQAWRYSQGRGVRVAVVDTGIAPRHWDLQVRGGASFVPGVTRWWDDHGHGTHVAGTIAALQNDRGVVGVAPQAQIYAVKVLNGRGSGQTSWILNGLAWCIRNRMHIVNLSLGSGATTHNPTDYSRAFEAAGLAMRRASILPVAAAGNSGGTRAPFVGNPARCPSYMAVSSIDCNRRRSPFSSYGPQVEICAPGSGVISTYPPATFRQLSGTSMAAPHVAAVAALCKQRYPHWHADTIRTYLWGTSLDLGTPGKDWFFGHGQTNALRAVL